MDFHGVKVALLFEGKLVMHLRDNKPELRFANMWDFPGGGREGEESPLECAIREIKEEFSIEVSSDAFVWKKEYPAMHDPDARAYFMVANASAENIQNITLNEGQRWGLVDIDTFFESGQVVPHLKNRFRDYLGAS